MPPPIRKATLIVRFWTGDNPTGRSIWHGTAEFIGGNQSSQFQTLDEFIFWLRNELAKAEEKPGL